MRPLLVLAHVLCGCALLLAGCAKLNFFKRSEPAAASKEGPCVGMAAPEIEGEDFDGEHFKLSDYRGKVVVVVYWASWCRPCREMIPHERELAGRFHDRPFVMLGVNLDENPDAARKIIISQGISWRCWQEIGACRWKVEHIPAVYVLDTKGIIRHVGMSGAGLDRAVETLLAEAEAKRPG